MENLKNNPEEQQDNNNVSADNDQLGENSEVTPLGEELKKDEENESENSENNGKAAKNPAPDDDAQLDIETVSP